MVGNCRLGSRRDCVSGIGALCCGPIQPTSVDRYATPPMAGRAAHDLWAMLQTWRCTAQLLAIAEFGRFELLLSLFCRHHRSGKQHGAKKKCAVGAKKKVSDSPLDRNATRCRGTLFWNCILVLRHSIQISYDDERRVTPALLNGASTVEVRPRSCC